MDSYLKNSVMTPYHDVISLVSLLAGKITHIGLGCTMSTSYYPPFLLARILAIMDHLSRGRIAWNVVTSFNPAEAKNFGLEKPLPHDERYERAEEYMDLVYQLWDAWEPDAVIEDRENGIMIDPSKVRHINFSGKYFKCRGPLNVSLSPRTSVIAQAGASPRGIKFAVKHAEVIFALKSSIDDMKKLYDEVKT